MSIPDSSPGKITVIVAWIQVGWERVVLPHKSLNGKLVIAKSG
jgi:hypothetical protein